MKPEGNRGKSRLRNQGPSWAQPQGRRCRGQRWRRASYYRRGRGLVLRLAGLGAARIKAAVTDERGQIYRECRIELLNTEDEHVLADRKEFGTFITTFVLAPTPKLYLLRIACEGSDQRFTSEPKLLGNWESSYRVPVDLGIIQLRRREHPPN